VRRNCTVVLALLSVCSTLTVSCLPQEKAVPKTTPTFDELATDFLSWYYKSHPVRATFLGVHDHDGLLQDLSSAGIDRRVGELRAWSARLETIRGGTLSKERAYDLRILDHAIRGELLELEEVRGWRNNPMRYNREIADGIASLVDREFAPLGVRLENLISRLELIPDIVLAARQNLQHVPRTWIEIATRSTRGTIVFLETSVPAALETQGLGGLDLRLRKRWAESHRRAVEQVRAFAEWIENDLAQSAGGDFRLGRELFERKLLYEEHLDVRVEELMQRNQQAIDTYEAWVDREASRIDTSLTPAEVMAWLTENHPTPEELIPTALDYVDRARSFVEERGIVTLPTSEMPIVRPTPEYARSGFASMSTPGPFETVATESYYNITNVDPSWSDEQQRQHLTYFNHSGLLGISVHEAMPGHFVQLLYRQQFDSDVRKVFAPRSLVEGWAHYTEQMMVDEGLGDGDPEIRLGQLRRALQRHARWYVGLAMHAYGASIDEAARRFEEIAYFEPFPARRETERGTYDPTYLYYALGRMEILRLREDYRAYVEERGETFSLREFHDRFLALGLPISLAREAMMPRG
jgi:hypothetical protein